MRIVTVLALCAWSCQGVREKAPTWGLGKAGEFLCGFSSSWSHPDAQGRNCSYPKLPDGFVVPYLDSYYDNSTAYYGCKEGKKPALETCWGEIKCVDGMWSHLPECIDASSCITPHVPNAEPQELRRHYSTGEEVKFRCKKAYSFKNNKPTALCENGQWDLPVCERHQHACDPPARVDNAMVKQELKELYAEGEELEFVCKPEYELKGSKTSICWQKSWTRLPECVSACGELPHIPDGTISEQADNMALVVQCPLYHKLFGPNKVYCDKGTWTELPSCKPPCVLDGKLFYLRYQNDKYLEEGARKTFYCNTNYVWMVVSCVNGRVSSDRTCPYPQYQ